MKYKLLAAIPFIILIYLIYVNLLPLGGTAVYSIDVGADDLQGTARLTGPMDRISEPQITDGITFRNLLQGLVYFDLKNPFLNNKGEVTVKVLFRDNFTEGQKFMLGAKNNESWSYAWKDIYVPLYESLKKYPSVKIGNKQVIMINGREISRLDELPKGSVIAANKDEVIGNGTIPDDGDQNKSNVLGMIQKAAFSFSNMETGVYRIKLIVGDDLLIRNIELDKGKLVTEGRLFLVGDNPAYFKDRNATPVEVYFMNPRNSTMKFQTYHAPGFQNITVKNGVSNTLVIDKTQKIFNLSLGSDKKLKTLTSEKGNVIIDSINYFSLIAFAKIYSPTRINPSLINSSSELSLADGCSLVIK